MSDLMFGSKPDKVFREGVVSILTAIGIDKESVEEGLETCAGLWREEFMRLAFHNVFEPFMPLKAPLEPADEKHKTNWLKLRRNEYYREH